MKLLFSFLIILLFLVGSPSLIFAEDLASLCQRISSSENSCQDMSTADCQATLQKCATYYDQQSAAIAQDLTKTKAQKDTLQNQVGLLKKKITGLEYQIQQGTLMVKDLNIKITNTESSINKTENTIEESEKQLKAILRELYAQQETSSIVVLLEGSLSDFFTNLTYLESLNEKVSDLIQSAQDLKSYLENQKVKIDAERGQVKKILEIQTLQKKESEKNKKQQESYLKITEAQYQKQQQEKADADKKAAAIKSRIFDLLGVSQAPSFGEAYSIAKYVSSVTGVRAALILAILTQESNLGKNVGQCYLKNIDTGDGVKIKTGAFSPRTMSPKRDVPIFMPIIEGINKGKGLNRDPLQTPVSCVIYYNGKPYGWGGAMGPSQFIPSTWISYGKKVESITGKTADPWDIRDAFIATGLLLKDNGALSNEFNAAMKYYCGNSCTSYDRFYGNSVISIANQYEADIKAIGG